MKDVWHFFQFSIFHICQYSGLRLKRPMLAFNADEFNMINRCCPGASAKHRHAKLGFDVANMFAIASETAYPMPLARRIASQFVAALKKLGVQIKPQVMSEVEVNAQDSTRLSSLRAEAGLQPRASKLPPLIPTNAFLVVLTTCIDDLPAQFLHQKLPAAMTLPTPLALIHLPKGSKFLRISSLLLPTRAVWGG